MTDGSLVWVMIGCVGLVLLTGLVVHAVPEHQRMVVTRFGCTARVSGPGITFRIPGLEQISTVSLRPRELPIAVSATTRDGISIQVVAHAVCRITDPARAVTVVPDALEATVEVLESRLQAKIAQCDIWSVLPMRASLESDFPAIASEVTDTWGVEVTELMVMDIETRLNGNLLRGLRRAPV